MTHYSVRISHTMYFVIDIDDASDEEEAAVIALDVWDKDLSDPVGEHSSIDAIEVVSEEAEE